MAFRVPELLRHEMRHCLEQLQRGVRRWDPRGWINAHSGLVIGVACLSAVLLCLVVVWVLWPTASASFQSGGPVWFYDVNTGQLFVGRSKHGGPIPAPSGPLPDGGPAGFRAHVYSYVLEPNESELFVGFLERPDPGAGDSQSTSDMKDFNAWARSRLIKRVEDKQWVAATGPEGREILQGLLRPNRQGQTPLYQTPAAVKSGQP